MSKVVNWFLGKCLDYLWDCVAAVGIGSVFAAVYSLWGLWRSIWIGLSISIAALALIQIWKQGKRFQKTTVGAKSSDDAELDLLLGSWTVQKNTRCEPTYLAVWKFTADHRVSVKTQGYETGGGWQLEATRVLIDWDNPLSNGEPCYDTFHRPIIGSGVRGDSWGGRQELNKIRASKIGATT